MKHHDDDVFKLKFANICCFFKGIMQRNGRFPWPIKRDCCNVMRHYFAQEIKKQN